MKGNEEGGEGEHNGIKQKDENANKANMETCQNGQKYKKSKK